MDNEIAVFWGEVPAAETVEALRGRLSEPERAQAQALRHDDDRHSYLYAHALLGFALDDVTGGRAPYDFMRTPAGQPHLADGQAAFSLTRRRRLAAVAISPDGPVGLDVEAVALDFDPMPIAEHLFALRELAALNALPDEPSRADHFVTLWTLKEALLKAAGLGLATGLASFAVAATPPSLLIRAPDGGAAADWSLAIIDLPGHRLALARPAGRSFSLRRIEAAALRSWAEDRR